MKRRENGLIDFSSSDLDPEVSKAIGQGRMKALPKRERDRKRKQQDKNQAAQPRRVDYLIDPEIKEWVKATAADLGCTDSQVVLFALKYLQSAIDHQEVDLNEYTEPIQNPRYSTRLNYPEVSRKG